MSRRLRLTLLEPRWAICRLGPDAPIPSWATGGTWLSVTRTADELSIVCEEGRVPPGVTASAGWRCLRLEGPFDLAATGVLASVIDPLAEAGVSVFAMATYDTDYVLVRDEALPAALDALRAAGHEPAGAGPFRPDRS